MIKSEFNNLLSTNSSLEDELKSELIALDSIPTQAQDYLANVLRRSSVSIYYLNSSAGAVLSLARSADAAARGDFRQIITWLHTSLQDPDREFGKMVAPFLSDVREILQKYSAVNEAWQALINAEIQLFTLLPYSELQSIVAGQLLPFVRAMDFLAEFRKVYHLSSPAFDDGTWCEPFIPLLKKNRELLSPEITIDEKKEPGSIANWLTDFHNHTQPQVERIQSFDIVRYVNNSPNGKALSALDRQILLKLLEFYLWLHDPYITREDAVALGLEIDEQAGKQVSSDQEEDQNQKSKIKNQNYNSKFKISEPDTGQSLIRNPQPVPVSRSLDEGVNALIRQQANSFDIDRIVHEPELPAPKKRAQDDNISRIDNQADKQSSGLPGFLPPQPQWMDMQKQIVEKDLAQDGPKTVAKGGGSSEQQGGKKMDISRSMEAGGSNVKASKTTANANLQNGGASNADDITEQLKRLKENVLNQQSQQNTRGQGKTGDHRDSNYGGGDAVI